MQSHNYNLKLSNGIFDMMIIGDHRSVMFVINVIVINVVSQIMGEKL